MNTIREQTGDSTAACWGNAHAARLGMVMSSVIRTSKSLAEPHRCEIAERLTTLQQIALEQVVCATRSPTQIYTVAKDCSLRAEEISNEIDACARKALRAQIEAHVVKSDARVVARPAEASFTIEVWYAPKKFRCFARFLVLIAVESGALE